MDWTWVILIYLGFGVIRAISHISSGKVGSYGVLHTFIFVTVLWPALLFFPK